MQTSEETITEDNSQLKMIFDGTGNYQHIVEFIVDVLLHIDSVFPRGSLSHLANECDPTSGCHERYLIGQSVLALGSVSKAVYRTVFLQLPQPSFLIVAGLSLVSSPEVLEKRRLIQPPHSSLRGALLQIRKCYSDCWRTTKPTRVCFLQFIHKVYSHVQSFDDVGLFKFLCKIRFGRYMAPLSGGGEMEFETLDINEWLNGRRVRWLPSPWPPLPPQLRQHIEGLVASKKPKEQECEREPEDQEEEEEEEQEEEQEEDEEEVGEEDL